MKVMHAADLTSELHLAAQLLELWRLCGKSRCRRARACRGDARRCCEALAGWSEILSRKDKRVKHSRRVGSPREC